MMLLLLARSSIQVSHETKNKSNFGLVFAVVRSRSYLFGYLNYEDIGNFGLADQKKAISFMKKSFKIMFGLDPKVTIIGDGFGAEHAGFHLFDEGVEGTG